MVSWAKYTKIGRCKLLATSPRSITQFMIDMIMIPLLRHVECITTLDVSVVSMVCMPMSDILPSCMRLLEADGRTTDVDVCQIC